jgi:hypothetical protein
VQRPVFQDGEQQRVQVPTYRLAIVSIALTAAAGAMLAALILPGQQRLLAAPANRTGAARLAMTTGVFNLLWAVVVVLMIVRPGSTTGA